MLGQHMHGYRTFYYINVNQRLMENGMEFYFIKVGQKQSVKKLLPLTLSKIFAEKNFDSVNYPSEKVSQLIQSGNNIK